MSKTFEEEYAERVNAWGRRVAKSKGLTLGSNFTFKIEGEKGYGGGCDTCGHGGDDGGFRLYVIPGYGLMAEYDFSDLGLVMKEIWVTEFPLYHKINGVYKRVKEGPDKGRFIEGAWSTPEFFYLKDAIWHWTEKIDGTNIRVRWHIDETGNYSPIIGGRTDNAQLPAPLAKKLYNETFDILPEDFDPTNMTLYGEGYGAGIQKGGAYRPDPGFILFDVKVGEFWLERADVLDIAERLGLDVVPQVGYSSLVQAIEHIRNREIKSAWSGVEIEGIVGTPAIPLFDRRGNRIIAKVKTVDFPL